MLGWFAKRLAQKSEQITGMEYTTPQMPRQRAGAPASFGNLDEFAVLRHHTLRALCGALMDRHSECERQQPILRPRTPPGRGRADATGRQGGPAA